MVGHPLQGSENALQGDFGEQWVEALAAGCGVLHGKPATLDLNKADVQLTIVGDIGGTHSPTVVAQVKTTVDLRVLPDGRRAYDLDSQTHNVLCHRNPGVERVLIVIGLSESGETVRNHPEGTLLVGQPFWTSLKGADPTTNAGTQVVYLDPANRLDLDGMKRMIVNHGSRRSTPVPEVDPWSEEEEPP